MMATKMVTNFRRSLSFPNQPSNNTPKPRKLLHVRSASLPCHTHPVISLLKHELAYLNSWSAAQPISRTSAWLCDGITRLKSLHDSLDDLLLLPQTRQSLHSNYIEKLLHDFLLFVDVYGMFQALILRLKEEYTATQIAVRRKDDSKIVAHSKNLNKIAKGIGNLVSNIILVRKVSPPPALPSSYDEEVELIEVINDVVKVTVLVSVALFGGIGGSLAFRKTTSAYMYMGISSFGLKMKNVIVEGGIKEFQEINLENLRKEEVKLLSKKMHELEDYLVEIEGCGEKAFWSLINTRVSLLNVLTQL